VQPGLLKKLVIVAFRTTVCVVAVGVAGCVVALEKLLVQVNTFAVLPMPVPPIAPLPNFAPGQM